jgi:hypothetical protein
MWPTCTAPKKPNPPLMLLSQWKMPTIINICIMNLPFLKPLKQMFSTFPDLGPHLHMFIDSQIARLYIRIIYSNFMAFIKNFTYYYKQAYITYY